MVKDYSRGKIYKIVCNITGKIYIGSTCEPTLARRLAKHVGNFRDWKKNNNKIYISSYQIIEEGDYYIDLLELYSCNSNDELRKKEREYYDKISCCNKINPFTSKEEFLQKKLEWTKNNPEKRKESQKKYREKNKEEISQKKKETYKINIEQYQDNYQINKEKVLEKRKEHYQKILLQNPEYNKEQYQKYIEKYKEYSKQKYTCEHCNEELLLHGKPRHERSLKHINNINLTNQLNQ